MSRALGETVIQDTLGNIITGCSIDLLDPSTGQRLTVPVYADATSATTLSLPFVSLDGKVSFYLALGQLVTVQATKGTVTATETIICGDPTQTGALTGGNPTGNAGGDLVGSSYPNPIVAPGAITTAKIATAAVTSAQVDASVEIVSHKGAVGGYAGLGADGLVPPAQLGTGTQDAAHVLSGAKTYIAVGTPLTVVEQDGSPSVAAVTTIKVSNGTLTDNGGGVVSLNTGASKFRYGPGFPSPVAGDAGPEALADAATTAVYFQAKRTGGTGALVDLQKNGVSILSTPLSLTTTAWTTASLVASPNLAANDTLQAIVTSVTGGVTLISTAYLGTQ